MINYPNVQDVAYHCFIFNSKPTIGIDDFRDFIIFFSYATSFQNTYPVDLNFDLLSGYTDGQ